VSEAVISFDNVYKSYGEVSALHGLSFTVPPRGCLGLLGPNGAGKTTAIKSLLGLTHLQSGKISSRARRIGYLPQAPALFGWMSASEYLTFVGETTGINRTELSASIETWLKRVDLYKVRRRRLSGYSGGMRQRLGIAAALLPNPDVLVLDEPVSALDPVGRHEILSLIDELKAESCVIMSTHILDDAQRVCDEVVIMRAGEALLQKSMSALRSEVSARYEIRLTGNTAVFARVQAGLQAQSWLASCHSEGDTLAVTLANGDADMPKLLRHMSDVTEAIVTGIAKSAVSLEDIFLRVVSSK